MKSVKFNEEVFRHLGDGLSRDIYINRLCYSNGSNETMEKIVSTVTCGIELIDFMNKHRNNLYIFGAGIRGRELAKTWGWKYPFCAFIDNDKKKQGKMIEKIPIISFEEIKETPKEIAVIIMSKFHFAEIAKQLQTSRVNENQILNIGNAWHQLNKAQYFDLEYLNIKGGENFIDCGAYDGDTSLNLYERYGNCINKIWMFEPDKRNAEKARMNFHDKKIDFEIIEKGVWSNTTKLHFDASEDVVSSISENGDVDIDTIKLDEALDGCHPTYIKMDVEGAELEALKGAERLIKKYRPKLAISVYHKREDIAEIPELLLTYNSNYSFYLRHYSVTNSETVLYAI